MHLRYNSPDMRTRAHVLAVIHLVIITAIWGITFPLQKLVLQSASPFVYNAVRFWMASLIAYFVFGKGRLKYGMILGIVLALSYASQTWGLSITHATKSGFITSLYIVVIPVFAYFLENERPSFMQTLSFFLAFVGLYLISGGVKGFNVGDLLTIGCAVGFALHVVLITKFSKSFEEKDLVFSQCLMVAILNTMFGLSDTWRLSGYTLIIALFAAFFATVYALWIQLKYQKKLGNNFTAMIYLCEPIFAALFSWLILGERLSFVQFMGCSLMILAIFMSSLKIERE